jgi:predicted nuclease with TOPRIM domain
MDCVMNPSKVNELKKKVEEVISVVHRLYDEKNNLLLENRKLSHQLEEIQTKLNNYQQESDDLERLVKTNTRLKKNREDIVKKLTGVLQKLELMDR